VIKKEKDKLIYHEFELLSDFPLRHACTTRHGGVSQGFFQSLNLGKSSGDDLHFVAANWQKVSKTLNFSSLVSAKLCHGDEVLSIKSLKDELKIADAITTDVKAIALSVTLADCQGAIFYDPIRKALSVVHCGWRGSVKNIYSKTISHMQQEYKSDPKDIHVCISPSLAPDHSEFINFKKELPECFWDFQVKENYFDFWAISEYQLKESGVLSHHIQLAKIDTFSNSKDYFSYRRDKICGRQAIIASL